MKIARVAAREVLDSRGYPTVEVDVTLETGHQGRMTVPSGASTGRFEAWELRDGDPRRFQGRGVRRAVANVQSEIAPRLVGRDALDQEGIDRLMIELDGTENKARLGANAILAVSFAVARAAAAAAGVPLYRYLADRYLPERRALRIPVPMVNILSGGLHAGKNVDFQDFLIAPAGASTYPEGLEMISAVYWSTRRLLIEKGHIGSLVADEGGFGPLLGSNREALDILCEAIDKAGLRPGSDIVIALDVASSHFFDPGSGRYRLESEKRELDAGGMVELLDEWVRAYPIYSIEDGLAEEDWDGWRLLTEKLGSRVQLVGDDLFTTNPGRIRKGIELRAGNAVLVKMNQIGTLTETVEAVRIAGEAGFRTVISARSGETEDATLADLAVGLDGGQIKIGSLARSSRLAKYNQLLRIGEEIGPEMARIPGIAAGAR